MATCSTIVERGESATSGEISFFGNPKYAAQLRRTQASAIFVPEDFAEKTPAAQVRVANPAKAFEQVVIKFAPEPVRFAPGVHPSAIVSPTAVKKFGQDYALQPVGTGPFKYGSWERGQRVVLEKNPSYWRFPVKIDRVVYRPIVEDQARLTELLTGSLDLIVGTPPDYVAQLESNPKVTMLKQVGAIGLPDALSPRYTRSCSAPVIRKPRTVYLCR